MNTPLRHGEPHPIYLLTKENEELKEQINRLKGQGQKGFTQDMHSYRLYADGRVVHEDDWAEEDNSLPYYDDYGQYDIPAKILEHISEESDLYYKKVLEELDLTDEQKIWHGLLFIDGKFMGKVPPLTRPHSIGEAHRIILQQKGTISTLKAKLEHLVALQSVSDEDVLELDADNKRLREERLAFAKHATSLEAEYQELEAKLAECEAAFQEGIRYEQYKAMENDDG